MRTTIHHGRGYGSKHNDRNFDLSKADHIDPERSAKNIYLNCYEDPTMTFQDVELQFYEDNFEPQLEATNSKYRKNGHPERCKTMKEWMQQKQHSPEESIFQIGNYNGTVPAQLLWECYLDHSKRMTAWSAAHGKPYSVLSAALHVDEEGAPHIHQRAVWHYRAEDGSLKVGQEKALAAAGVELPDPGTRPSRKNNRKMKFDAMRRQMWLEVLQEHGIRVETQPLPDGKHNRSKEQMIRDKHAAIVAETQQLQEEIEPYRDLKIAIDEVDLAVTGKPFLGGMVLHKPEDLAPILEQAKAYRVNRDEIADLRDKEQFLDKWHERLEDRAEEINRQGLILDDYAKELQHSTPEWLRESHQRLQEENAGLKAENARLTAENRSLQSKVSKLQQSLNEQLRGFQRRLKAAHETLTNVIRATGMLQRSKILDAIRSYAAAQTREAGYEDLANSMQQAEVSSDIRQHMAPEKTSQIRLDMDDLER